MAYICIFITIICTVAGQVMLKQATNSLGPIPGNFYDGAKFLINALLNVYIIGGFGLAFIASLTWIAAVSRLELSFAYPFTGLNFVLVLLLSAYFFQEPLSWSRTLGVLAICGGIYLVSRS
jgi:multidrug transporter EmrE-like cation transporter